MCNKAEAIWDANRYLREESPCWAAGSTASKECWLDREELWLVSTDLERSNELRYQRSACWSLIACGTNRTLFTRPSHLKNRINIKRVTNTQITEEFTEAKFGTSLKQRFSFCSFSTAFNKSNALPKCIPLPRPNSPLLCSCTSWSYFILPSILSDLTSSPSIHTWH